MGYRRSYIVRNGFSQSVHTARKEGKYVARERKRYLVVSTEVLFCFPSHIYCLGMVRMLFRKRSKLTTECSDWFCDVVRDQDLITVAAVEIVKGLLRLGYYCLRLLPYCRGKKAKRWNFEQVFSHHLHCPARFPWDVTKSALWNTQQSGQSLSLVHSCVISAALFQLHNSTVLFVWPVFWLHSHTFKHRMTMQKWSFGQFWVHSCTLLFVLLRLGQKTAQSGLCAVHLCMHHMALSVACPQRKCQFDASWICHHAKLLAERNC